MKRWLVTLVAAGAMSSLTFAGGAKQDAVTLQSTIGCAHCTYHKGSSCAVGLKTAAGKVDVLEHASKGGSAI